MNCEKEILKNLEDMRELILRSEREIKYLYYKINDTRVSGHYEKYHLSLILNILEAKEVTTRKMFKYISLNEENIEEYEEYADILNTYRNFRDSLSGLLNLEKKLYNDNIDEEIQDRTIRLTNKCSEIKEKKFGISSIIRAVKVLKPVELNEFSNNIKECLEKETLKSSTLVSKLKLFNDELDVNSLAVLSLHSEPCYKMLLSELDEVYILTLRYKYNEKVIEKICEINSIENSKKIERLKNINEKNFSNIKDILLIVFEILIKIKFETYRAERYIEIIKKELEKNKRACIKDV